MEELLLDLGELEEVEKFFTSSSLRIPVVHVGALAVSFNKACRELLGEAVRWFTTSEYVIGLPANRGDKNAFSLKTTASGACMRSAYIPAVLRREKKIGIGYYKLYKYKNGFAFKRYEQINPAEYMN